MERREVLAAIGLGSLALATGAVPALAASRFEIKMLARDPGDPTKRMLFTPDVLKVQPGSTITFTPTNPGHNAQSTPGMIPTGAEPFRFGIGRAGSVTLTQPGFYGYHCLPHRGMGMVGLIIVEGPGMRDNLAAAKAVRQPGKAAARWEALWAKADRLS